MSTSVFPHREACGFYPPDIVGRQKDLGDGPKRLYGGTKAEPNEQLAGTEKILEYDAYIFKTHSARVWRAPALGCEWLKSDVPANGDVLEASSITIGEPDPALFSLAGLTEVSPSGARLAVYNAVMKLDPDPAKAPKLGSPQDVSRDKDYYDRKAKWGPK